MTRKQPIIDLVASGIIFFNDYIMQRLLCLLIILFFLVSGSFAQGKADQQFTSYKQAIPGSSLQFSMVPIPAGKFTMGSPDKAVVKEGDEQPAHTIAVKAFWMGAHEVTYDEYDVFAQDAALQQGANDVDAVTRPTSPYIDMTLGMGKNGGFPANSMQQYGAMMYCKWLYTKTGIFFRLPSEAEWEYACRAGSTTLYPFGDDSAALAQYAWYGANSDGKYHKVGELKPNAWGLYDMLGNVSEWTLDQYDENFYQALSDTSTAPVRLPTTKHPRTVRGGSYRDAATELRSANRTKSDPAWNRRDPQIPKSRWWNADAPFVGFRIVRPLQQPTPEEAEAYYSLYLYK